MNDMVSIIVPIYNSEKYLHACLDSIVSQTYKNIEIILIDDGSTDSSSQICDEYKNNDSRIIVKHNQNRGVSYSRNCGINISTGERILFIDSDDTVEISYVETLMEPLKDCDYDLVMCNMKQVYKNKKVNVKVENKKITGDFFTDYYELRALVPFPFLKLYKSDIIKKHRIYFPEEVCFSEDQIFNFKYFYFIRHYTFVNQHLYNYYNRSNQSLSQIHNSKTFQDILSMCFLKKEYLTVCKIHNKERLISDTVINAIWWYLEDDYNTYNAFGKRINKLKELLIFPYKGSNFKRVLVLRCLQWNLYPILYGYFLFKNKEKLIKR
jgi:glycosyltransferase involved in cell wall biosynthesis